MNIPRQCAILVGGLGTRLGALTSDTPKPLLDCGGRPFLAWVLRELSRFGITKIILLAGYQSQRVEAFCRDLPAWLPKPLSVEVSTEPSPAGTGGALWHARHLLEDTFLLINGDSWLDTNLARFFAAAAAAPDASGAVLLRSMPDCSRYGRAELHGDRIVSLHEKSPLAGPGLINGGLYVFDRAMLTMLSPVCSLERDILPAMAKQGRLAGFAIDGYFIDIGIPSDYERAGIELPTRLRRPAFFFDEKSIFNQNPEIPGSGNRFGWRLGALDALRLINDAGAHVFSFTNQSGNAGAEPGAANLDRPDDNMLQQLLRHGATIDDISTPVSLTDPANPKFDTQNSVTPTILDLLSRWDVHASCSMVIGTAPADLQSAVAARVEARLDSGGNLLDLIEPLVRRLQSRSGA